jgi:hypothetical protein
MLDVFKQNNLNTVAELNEKVKNKVELDDEDVYGIEDCLSSYDVFYNGISGKPCHSDSYMTCVAFDKLDIAIKELDLPEIAVRYAIDYWLNNPNCQPPSKIVAICWQIKLDS